MMDGSQLSRRHYAKKPKVNNLKKKGIVRVTLENLKPYVFDVFKGIGVPENDAKICTDVLLDADLKGFDTHGVNRLKPIYYDRVRNGLQSAVTNFELIREGPTTAVVNGNNGMGMVIAEKAMDLSIRKAKNYGMGMVAVRNSTHFGIAGYYTEMAVKNGMIGICGTNARPSMAPTFSVEPMLGTNPLSFAFPTDEEFPFSLDCATSIIQRGKIELYAREDKELPTGVIVMRDGSQNVNPEKVLQDLLSEEAALLPLGGAGEATAGYKGYGYATVVEILSASLQSGCFLKSINGVNLGHFFIAIDVSAFTELEDFKKRTGDILRTLRSARKTKDAERVYTAGEKEYLVSQYRKKNGIPINPSVQKDLIQMKKELNLNHIFSFE
jgi:LDH2 family malate/lactate/ureidoglycolate dehydrogenase